MQPKIRITSNIEIHSDENYIIVSLNPKIFSLEAINTAAFSFLENCHVSIYGDSVSELFVEMRPKDPGTELESLGRKFNDILIRSQFEYNRSVNEP